MWDCNAIAEPSRASVLTLDDSLDKGIAIIFADFASFDEKINQGRNGLVACCDFQGGRNGFLDNDFGQFHHSSPEWWR